MRIGKRKVMAAGGLLLVVVVALTAWLLWGTDGLLAATLGTLLLSTMALGWLVVQSQRQVRELIGQTRSAPVSVVSTTDPSGEQAERLLRAVHAGFVRSDHVLDTLVSEWAKFRDELLPTADETET